jgi:hypothetical protein
MVAVLNKIEAKSACGSYHYYYYYHYHGDRQKKSKIKKRGRKTPQKAEQAERWQPVSTL